MGGGEAEAGRTEGHGRGRRSRSAGRPRCSKHATFHGHAISVTTGNKFIAIKNCGEDATLRAKIVIICIQEITESSSETVATTVTTESSTMVTESGDGNQSQIKQEVTETVTTVTTTTTTTTSSVETITPESAQLQDSGIVCLIIRMFHSSGSSEASLRGRGRPSSKKMEAMICVEEQNSPAFL